MEKELFKELNAHVRACDNKALTLNAAYLGGLVFVNSTRAEDKLLGHALSSLGVDLANYETLLGLTFILSGYLVLFAQIWFRSWKVQYLNILHKMWSEKKDEFGAFVPVWMKRETPIMGWDNLFRMVPFFINSILIVSLAGNVSTGTENFLIALIFFIVLHLIVSIAILRIVSKSENFSA